jgi:hypothetical protein
LGGKTIYLGVRFWWVFILQIGWHLINSFTRKLLIQNFINFQVSYLFQSRSDRLSRLSNA